MIPFSVVVEDPTPCEVCGGDGIVPVTTWDLDLVGDQPVATLAKTKWVPCPGCNCGVCGKPTDTPPECGDCALAEDDRWRRAS